MGKSEYSVKLIMRSILNDLKHGEKTLIGDIDVDNISESTKTRAAKELCDKGILKKDGRGYYPGKIAEEWSEDLLQWHYKLFVSFRDKDL